MGSVRPLALLLLLSCVRWTGSSSLGPGGLRGGGGRRGAASGDAEHARGGEVLGGAWREWVLGQLQPVVSSVSVVGGLWGARSTPGDAEAEIPPATGHESAAQAFREGTLRRDLLPCDSCATERALWGLARDLDGLWVRHLCPRCVKAAEGQGPWQAVPLRRACFSCRRRALYGRAAPEHAAPGGGVGGGAKQTFGLPVHCKVHKLADEIAVVKWGCAFEGCERYAMYGEPGKRALWCRLHKGSDDVDQKNRRCSVQGCSKQPSYGDVLKGTPEVCAVHREAFHVDVRNRGRRCKHPYGCRKLSIFGVYGGKPQFCAEHRSPFHIDVMHDQCRSPEGCVRQPCFGSKEEGIALFCLQHKDPDHVDVKSSMCQYVSSTGLGCVRRATFGTQESGIPRYCSTHKAHDHVDVIHNPPPPLGWGTVQALGEARAHPPPRPGHPRTRAGS